MYKAKWKIALAMLMMLMVFTTGCGQKDASDIVKDLDKQLSSLSSYKGVGTMQIQIGENPQEYSVEVWYKEPQYYRILLNNMNSNITQIILKNDDGVFVLDPSIKKSYRFKSDWPETGGQPYLFQSLAKSILDDEERIFTQEEDNYTFQVKANYQNQMLNQQKVWLDDDLHPVKVSIYDANETMLVDLVFDEFEFNVDFEDDAFEMERNLTSLDTLPTMGEVDNSKSFGLIEPSYIPEGVTKQSPKILNKEDGRTVVIKYTGEFNYNLTEARPKAMMASAPDSSLTDIVDLGFGIGIMTEMTDSRTLNWTYNGVDFQLSGDLPAEEMVSVAKSVLGQPGK